MLTFYRNQRLHAAERAGSRIDGFTLIELLISIVVLSILAAIAYPSFNQLIQNSQNLAAAEAVKSGLVIAKGKAILTNKASFTLNGTSGWTIRDAAGTVLETSPDKEGAHEIYSTTIPAGTTTVTFSNLGDVVANDDASPSIGYVEFTTPNNKKLRVNIGVGPIRICDPNLNPADSLKAC